MIDLLPPEEVEEALRPGDISCVRRYRPINI